MELNFNSAVREQFGCVVLLDLITSLSVALLPACLPAHQRFSLCAPRKSSGIFFVGYELDFSIAFFRARTRDSLSSYSVQLSAPDSSAIPGELTFQPRHTRLSLSSPRGSNCDFVLPLVLDEQACTRPKYGESLIDRDVFHCSHFIKWK